MANVSVTYTFTNGTTADATQVNQNFTDLINGSSDGTKDYSIAALTCAGTATFNGAVTLGNGTGDDLTFTGYVASSFIPKTNGAYDLGSSTNSWQALYLDDAATNGGAIYFDAGSTEFIKALADGTDLTVGGFTGFNLAATAGTIAEIKTFALHDVAKSAAYTVTDSDGASIVYVTTSSTDRTITLPTASANAGRAITIKKVDSGTGKVTVDGEGAETIDGEASLDLLTQYDWVQVQCNGTAWFIINGGGPDVITTYSVTSAAALSTSGQIDDLNNDSFVISKGYTYRIRVNVGVYGSTNNGIVSASVIIRNSSNLDSTDGTLINSNIRSAPISGALSVQNHYLTWDVIGDDTTFYLHATIDYSNQSTATGNSARESVQVTRTRTVTL
jgi:hypothetical protein